METRPVSRCIAIAAHGKRCQQSPFRGSPYCWHHTQSRKVWPPSRPATTLGRVAGPPAEADDVVALQAREESRQRTGEVVSRRLVEVLDEEGLDALLAFLETDGDATVLLAREGGHVAAAVGRPASRRHASR